MINLNNLSNLLNQTTILYVEDDDNTQSTIAEVLAGFCKEVVLAFDGADALEIYKKGGIDLIITDIEMPVMSGIEFVEIIRKTDRDTPVIMLSAYSTKDYLFTSANLGIEAFVEKPISYKKIKDALYNAAKVLNLKSNNYVEITKELAFDKINACLVFNNEEILLKKKEIDLINLLIENKNNLVTYGAIEAEVWNKNSEVMSSTALRTVVKKIRALSEVKFIENISGLGYKINIESDNND